MEIKVCPVAASVEFLLLEEVPRCASDVLKYAEIIVKVYPLFFANSVGTPTLIIGCRRIHRHLCDLHLFVYTEVRKGKEEIPDRFIGKRRKLSGRINYRWNFFAGRV